MFRNYLKTAIRNGIKAKSFTIINVTGLAVSLSLSMMIILIINNVLRTDEFHEKKDRIGRVITTVISNNATQLATAPLPMGAYLETSFPQVQSVLKIQSDRNTLIEKDETYFPSNTLFVDPTFFQFFDFELKYGDIDRTLNDPSMVVLSEEMAMRLFGDINPISQSVKFTSGREYVVSGVVSELPRHQPTHLRFDALVPFESYAKSDPVLNDFFSLGSGYVYFMLSPGADVEALEVGLDAFATSTYHDSEEPFSFEIQRLTEISPGKALRGQIGANITMQSLYLILSLVVILVFIAAFNYTNLSIARTLKRAKEVGIRKVLGANRKQLVLQFLVESMMFALLALVLAIPIHDFILIPFFFNIGVSIEIPTIFGLLPSEMLLVLGFTLTIGLVAGIFPSLIISSIRIVSVIKGVSGLNVISRVNVRKILISVQFTICTILIVSLVTSIRQYAHQRQIDFGFEHENIVNVRLNGAEAGVFRNMLLSNPLVEDVSVSSLIPGGNASYVMSIQDPDSGEAFDIEIVNTDEFYLSTFGLNLLAGSNFSPELVSTNHQGVILNRSALKPLGFETPLDAVDATIGTHTVYRIVGVVEDFSGSVLNPTAPLMLMYGEDEYAKFTYINARITNGSVLAGVEVIKKAWEELNLNEPIAYSVFSDFLDSQFQELRNQMKLFTLLAGIVILVALLGLFGMSIYSAESRLKEVGIRKVMGGRVREITTLLSKDFIKLIVAGILIGTPLAWLLNNLLLQEYASRISLGIDIFLISTLSMLILGLLTIGSQTYKAAMSNPVTTLRQE